MNTKGNTAVDDPLELSVGMGAYLVKEASEEKVVSFDIETYKWEERPLLVEKIIEKKKDNRLKDPAKIEANIAEIKEKFALDPFTGKIILSGFYTGPFKGGEGFSYFNHENEADLIKSTIEEIDGYLMKGYKLLSKGGRRFDIPYLIVRAAVLNVQTKWTLPISGFIGRYNNMFHTDIELIFDHSLQTVGYALGLTDSPQNKGGEIAQMYEENNWDAIIAKNQEDLKLTYNIYQRIKWWNL